MQNSKLNANEIKMATLLELEIYARDVCVCVCVCVTEYVSVPFISFLLHILNMRRSH